MRVYTDGIQSDESKFDVFQLVWNNMLSFIALTIAVHMKNVKYLVC